MIGNVGNVVELISFIDVDVDEGFFSGIFNFVLFFIWFVGVGVIIIFFGVVIGVFFFICV